MTKVIGMLVALAMFGAMPAVAFAGSSDNVSSGNTQTGNIDQGAAGGDSTAGGGSGSDGDDGGSGGDAASGDGGDAGNQAAICQQNAGRDANCSIDQSQSFGGDTFAGGNGGGDDGHDNDNDNDNDGVGGGGDFDDNDNVTSGGTGGGVDSVTLARTGFDAWVLALIGGLSLAGGLGLLAAQRRGRLSV